MKSISLTSIIILILVFTGCSNKPDVKVIAHRGGSHLAPENTMAAFKNAIKLGVDMIEIDVEQTKESVVVVIHDATVDRTTNGTGAVDTLSWDYVKSLNASQSWKGDNYKDEKISTLDEVLELLKGTGVTLLIEIKEGSERYPGIEKRTVDAIQKFNAYSWAIVQSFNKKAVERVKQDDENIKTFYLLGRSNFRDYYNKIRREKEQNPSLKFNYDGLAVSYKAWSKQSLDSVKQMGLETYAWTVGDTLAMKELIDNGITGIITDDPDVLLEIVNR
jgi:glycerophosphoryl diester phosphodiesterase